MNEQNEKSFSEQLLSQEKTNTRLQKNVQMEVKKMYTEKLKMRQRLACMSTGLLIGFLAFLFWLFAKIFEEMQLKYQMSSVESIRLASMWAMFLSIVLIVFALWPAIRGKVSLRFYPKTIRFISCVLILAVAFLFFGIVEFLSRVEVLQLSASICEVLSAAFLAVLIIIMSLYLLLSGRIDRSGLDSKAKTLELEYRLAALEEKLNSSPDKSAGPDAV